MRGSGALAIGLVVSLLCGAAGAGELAGRVTLAVEGTRLADLGPTVIYLSGNASAGTRASGPPPVIRQHNAHFEPDFLIVQAGRAVEMPNDDTIFHNVFSFSRPNDFDLGTYPAGQSRSVVFRHPGLVRVYCSIHESMSAIVVVTPSPWYARVGADGEYRIAGVPPGRYQVTIWNERLPGVHRTLSVREDGTTRADFSLGDEGS